MHQSHTEAYTARLDAHLPTLADDAAKRHFLNVQLSKFETDYVDFQRRAARGELTPEDGVAATYVGCMAEITKRLAHYPEVAHAA